MKIIITAVILLLCTFIPAIAIFVHEDARTSDLTAEILARAPERGNFWPREVVVPAGKKVKLRIRNVDTVTHGFVIPAMDIRVGDIKAGHYAIVEFIPEKPGEYAFYCTAWCSEFHLQMRGVLEVTAP
jgi:heme/copper-type cytochrome/quinol oxidase subunit 2